MKVFKVNIYCFSFALLSEGAFAYIPDTHITDGGLFVKPSLEIGVVHDDNIHNEQTDGTGSIIMTVIPSVNFKMDNGVNYYSLDMNAEKGIYEATGNDNYTDGELGLKAHIEPNDTHRVDLSLKREWLTESRGTGKSEGNFELTEEPITYGKNTLVGAYGYGALQTKGRLVFDLKYYEKEYRNFEDITRRSNYDSLLLGSTFYYATRAHTDTFIEVNAEKIGYDYNAPGELRRDSDVYTALLGMQWEASSIVRGFIKIGGQAKEFDDAGRDDFTGFSWNVGGVWRPLTYSKLTFSTSQATDDPDVDGDYVLETKYNVDWKHDWASYYYTSVGIYKYKDDYSGISREDDIYGLTVKFNYDISQNIAVAVFGELDRNQSTDTVFEYDKNVVGVSFKFTL
ncbi:outer membrane beta-barrel protein [Moritella sp. Urea-trap-13]|uniref:outer membrane beta-barrel protein n=1 Tax=Moritella sp. Urea-trap-13 TaxID=2058327 RepID=UPI000C330B7D|nr:outer membrane beta-barrel protein [Moritella sp. Urea-trap-13]PKH06260.1 hypothetical protein CXF93_10065 [Moritella sp. Urea-trap-13]